MSQWTHVAAIFRLDSFGEISDEDIYKVFGKEVTWNDYTTMTNQIIQRHCLWVAKEH